MSSKRHVVSGSGKQQVGVRGMVVGKKLCLMQILELGVLGTLKFGLTYSVTAPLIWGPILGNP